MGTKSNIPIYGLQEAFLTMPDGENLNLVSPGYFFNFNPAIRNTIEGFTQPNPNQLSLYAGVYWLTVNLTLDIIVAAGTSARYGMFYYVEIGGSLAITPATYSYVTDSTDTGYFGDAFTFPIAISASPTIVRLNSIRNRGGTGSLLTLNGCSLGILKVS